MDKFPNPPSKAQFGRCLWVNHGLANGPTRSQMGNLRHVGQDSISVYEFLTKAVKREAPCDCRTPIFLEHNDLFFPFWMVNVLTFYRDLHLRERWLILNFGVCGAEMRANIGAVKTARRVCSSALFLPGPASQLLEHKRLELSHAAVSSYESRIDSVVLIIELIRWLFDMYFGIGNLHLK